MFPVELHTLSKLYKEKPGRNRNEEGKRKPQSIVLNTTKLNIASNFKHTTVKF